MSQPGAPNFEHYNQNYGNTYKPSQFYGQQPSPNVDYSQNDSSISTPQSGLGLTKAPSDPAIPTGAFSYTAGNSGHQATINQWGLRDKYDQGGGLMQVNPLETQFTVLTNTIIVDTRDCIGKRSLTDARAIFVAKGGRGPAQGTITNVTAGNPIVVTFNSVDDLVNGDLITIQNVRGITNVNGVRGLSNINTGLLTAEISSGGTGTYAGGGTWTRAADHGYPEINEDSSVVKENVLSIPLNKKLKNIRTLTLYHIVVPRDIIPLPIYLADFISASTDENNTVYTGFTETNYTTWIPQEAKYMESRMLGFYSTPLDMWRTYTFGAFSMQDQYTPPPLQLWNPPGPGVWPDQPIPYPYQTVPTYRSNDFTISVPTVIPGDFYLVLAGYGVYDLVDWTVPGGTAATALATSIIRKLLLFLITPKQSYNDVDYIDLILNCNTVNAGSTDITIAYGFGDFQRYVPGPGVGQAYQPGTYNLGGLYTNGGGGVAQPNVVNSDNPIPFPNFLGNVWGPYNKPGDRFQRLGLRSTVQDLYLNGDLNNLLGSPIIVPTVPVEGIVTDQSFGLNFSALIECNLANITDSTNPNILNAMRIVPNGFGAASIRANGGGTFYTNQYNGTAGGQGPSTLGTPSAWVNTGIYGAASFGDPIAQGPAGPNTTAATADASFVGTTTPTYATSYFDLGQNNGAFQLNITRYISYVVNDLPDTDLIIRVEEALREERCQSTRSINSDAILDCPIRLNLGSTSGTLQYVESLQSLLAGATGYWEKRYLEAKSEISRLNISFWAYEGQPIPLEQMLQIRRSLDFLQLFIRVNQILDIDFETSPFSFSFLFDPLNPQLIGRVKRYFQIIFKADTYHGTPPGREPTAFTNIPPGAAIPSDIRPYA